MRREISIFILCVWAVAALAVPATREPIVQIGADGRPDTIYLHGDEYASYRTDARGVRIPSGGTYSPEAEQLARARAPQRTLFASYLPSSGTVRVPVILVSFSDYAFTIDEPLAKFDDLFNGNGGSNPHATGSVRDYYEASSHNALHLQYEVFGPYTLSREMAYYGDNDKNLSGEVTDHTPRARELIIEAVNLAHQAGVNFSVYDNNNDGYVDNISVIVAGYNEAEGGAEQTIWPHYSVINNSGKFDGKSLGGYLMTSEYRGNNGKIQAGIGTYCHEFGHALGLPDLYDTGTSDHYTVGTWDIMCSGSYNNQGATPPTYTAFERFVMGWLRPEQITGPGMYTLAPIETSNRAYLISYTNHNLDALSPSPSEYFLLENRQAVGWDAGEEALVAEGLLVTHITFNKNTWNYNTFNNREPLGFAIVSAGQKEQTQSSPADVFPGSMQRTSCTPTLNDGTELTDYRLSDIMQWSNSSLSFAVGTITDKPLRIEPQTLDTFVTSFSTRIEEYGQQAVTIYGRNLSSRAVYIGTTGKYCLSLDGEKWGKNAEWITDSVAQDGSYQRQIYVRFKPDRRSCSVSSGQLIVLESDSSTYTSTSLIGIAPRPMYLTTADSLYVDMQSENSFRIRWSEVEDAEYYYVTLYQPRVSKQDTTYTLIERREVVAPNTAAIFEQLQSGQQYLATVEAAEHKSCFERIAPAASIQAYTTVVKKRNRVIPVLLDDGRYVLWVGEPLEQASTMAIFRADGTCLFSLPIEAGTFNPEIPLQRLQRGELYLIKLYSDRIRRNDFWAKFMY